MVLTETLSGLWHRMDFIFNAKNPAFHLAVASLFSCFLHSIQRLTWTRLAAAFLFRWMEPSQQGCLPSKRIPEELRGKKDSPGS